jgi:hypothetical protein
MAGVASAQAAAASAAAHAARVAQCKTVLPNFNAQGATVSEMKEYAGCVETLYPTEIGADATVALKVLFVVALAGMAVGAWRDRGYGFGDSALGGLFGFILAPLALASIAGLALGIRWLFS